MSHKPPGCVKNFMRTRSEIAKDLPSGGKVTIVNYYLINIVFCQYRVNTLACLGL